MNNLKYKSLDEILRSWLIKKEEEGKLRRDNDWWYASELGTCLRKQFLRRLGINSPRKEFRIYFIMEQGKVIHNWIENSVKEMGVLVASEERLIDEKRRLKMRFDLIINFGSEKKPYLSLIDIKTQRPEAFFRRAKQPVGKRVNSFQKKQLAAYFYYAKKKWPGLKESRIYYLDRGGGVRDEYVFKFKKETFDTVFKELDTLNKYWKEQKLPPCSNTWMCKETCSPLKKELLLVEKGKISLKEFIKNYDQRNKK